MTVWYNCHQVGDAEHECSLALLQDLALVLNVKVQLLHRRLIIAHRFNNHSRQLIDELEELIEVVSAKASHVRQVSEEASRLRLTGSARVEHIGLVSEDGANFTLGIDKR